MFEEAQLDPENDPKPTELPPEALNDGPGSISPVEFGEAGAAFVISCVMQ